MFVSGCVLCAAVRRGHTYIAACVLFCLGRHENKIARPSPRRHIQPFAGNADHPEEVCVQPEHNHRHQRPRVCILYGDCWHYSLPESAVALPAGCAISGVCADGGDASSCARPSLLAWVDGLHAACNNCLHLRPAPLSRSLLKAATRLLSTPRSPLAGWLHPCARAGDTGSPYLCGVRELLCNGDGLRPRESVPENPPRPRHPRPGVQFGLPGFHHEPAGLMMSLCLTLPSFAFFCRCARPHTHDGARRWQPAAARV